LHRHRPDGLIVKAAESWLLPFAPARGRVEITLTARSDDGFLVAASLVGTEERSPPDSGESCVVEIDASRVHTWALIGGDGETLVGCEGVAVRRIPQAPNDPMVLMIDLFVLGTPGGRYPKTAVVERVRAWTSRVLNTHTVSPNTA
jgi:hypothetical protein